jgi:hypothetical protein
MGARSYIVRGLGNDESFHSSSHGAGRTMSRTAAKKRFTLADHAAATKGVECRQDEEVIDETPGAYKSIEAVMEAQRSCPESCGLRRGAFFRLGKHQPVVLADDHRRNAPWGSLSRSSRRCVKRSPFRSAC